MADALDQGRAREIEAERLRAFRETARRVAHEMRNPLTPIRLAVAQLAAQRRAPASRTRSRSWWPSPAAWSSSRANSPSSAACPRGPPRRWTWRSSSRSWPAPACRPRCRSRLTLDPALPTLLGHYDPLRRAFSNIVRNAVEACDGHGELELCRPGGQRRGVGRDPRPRTRRAPRAGRAAVRSLRDRQERRHRAGAGAGQADRRDAPRHHRASSRRPGAAPRSSCGSRDAGDRPSARSCSWTTRSTSAGCWPPCSARRASRWRRPRTATRRCCSWTTWTPTSSCSTS